MPTHGDGLGKGARLLVLREVLEQWPDCPTAYTAGACGVTLRTAQRDRRELRKLSMAADRVRSAALAHRDPDWLTDAEVRNLYGYTHAYLYDLSKRRPDLRRQMLGQRRWSRAALDDYLSERPEHGRRGGYAKRR